MKSPQEKKALSYEKDHRNAYGENDKASRKAIPLRKRLVNRANRHDARRLLDAATGQADADAADAAEQRALGKRPKRWAKTPDQPLGEYLARKTRRRSTTPFCNTGQHDRCVPNEHPVIRCVCVCHGVGDDEHQG